MRVTKINYFSRGIIMGLLSLTTSTVLIGTSAANSFTLSTIESEVYSKLNNSSPIYFDLILDEKISINDPRLKSIIYVCRTNPRNLAKVVYTNPNAKELSEKLASILSMNGVKIQPPQLVTPATNHENTQRFVTLWIVYPKYNSSQDKNNQSSSELVMESR